MRIMESVGNLSNLQIELLRMFHYNLPDNQLLEVKKLLSDFFAKNLTDEVDKFYEKNNWDENTINLLKEEHLKTKYE